MAKWSVVLLLFCIGTFFIGYTLMRPSVSGAPPYGEPEAESPRNDDRWAWLRDWTRPEGPVRVGLQVGHWKNDQLPEELEKLRGNTGSSGGGKSEWEVNLAIAEKVAATLKEERIMVDILPATIPPSYWADVFVAIHADGSLDSHVSGYKFAAPWRDFTAKADILVDILQAKYGLATGLSPDLNISRNMRGYYAFAWWRYEHSIHPMTTAVIAETGFLTNPSDRKLLIGNPGIPARAIAESIMEFLEI